MFSIIVLFWQCILAFLSEQIFNLIKIPPLVCVEFEKLITSCPFRFMHHSLKVWLVLVLKLSPHSSVGMISPLL
ncbi:unnamed protein product [Moneuplotes crassus]|uniref:Uncharacterized protein n=1 Tax=Euplotes crassus TaxID=5936 RepID=A0AAD1YAK0_EUPCR|nr:unnamed protein product [Moneuplotes crassus]